MTRALFLAADFQEAVLCLQELLNKFQRDLQDLPRWSDKWQETADRYRGAIKQMPKVLRRHPFVVKSLAEIEALEREIRNGGLSFAGLQARARQAAVIFAELEDHPYIQKFLRGETVLSSRKNLQWRRKLTHASLGLTFLYVFFYSGWPKAWIWAITAPFIIGSFSLETARHLSPRVNTWVLRWFGPIMREAEKTRINSAVFYIFSMAVVYFVCPPPVTILTLFFIALGDPFAGIVGVLWGRRRISTHVTWEGSGACFLACTALAALSAGFLFPKNLSALPLAGFSVLSGLTGSVAEASLKKLDDNLVMPLLSAPVLWILMRIFGIL